MLYTTLIYEHMLVHVINTKFHKNLFIDVPELLYTERTTASHGQKYRRLLPTFANAPKSPQLFDSLNNNILGPRSLRTGLYRVGELVTENKKGF